MADNAASEDTLLTLTADIVAAHVSNNSVAVNDLPSLIQNVHAALTGISGTSSAPEPTTLCAWRTGSD
jgi:predicted transcriptional regulator